MDLCLKELIKLKSSDKKDKLIRYLYSINYKSKFNLSFDEFNEIKSNIKREINSNMICSTDQIESKFNKFVKQKIDTKNKLFDYLYGITGEFEIKDSFISYLKEYDLSVNDGKEIREKVKTAIENCNVKTFEDIQLKIDNLIKQKQTNELIDYLYSIMGRDGVKFSFRNNFPVDLSESDFNEIRINLINEIESNNLRSKDEIDLKIEKIKNENSLELFEELYKNVGENNLSNEFLERLSNNNLNEVNGNYIKQIIEEEIKNKTIKDKSVINSKIYNLIKQERERQNKAIIKLYGFFKNNNAYLIQLSSKEKQEVKHSVEKSIMNNRLDESEVYTEFKKKIDEIKKNKKPEDSKINEKDDKSDKENKSSGGLMSRLKKLFS